MNTQDREEFGAMKADMLTVKAGIGEIKTDLKQFIDCADKKYATKREVDNIEEQFETYKSNSQTWVRWIPTIIIGIIAVIDILIRVTPK